MAPTDRFRTKDDIRLRLIEQYPTETNRIDAALALTHGLLLIRQYELAKSFIYQVQQEQNSQPNHTFVNGSFVNEFD
jgi:hypothetical protein